MSRIIVRIKNLSLCTTTWDCKSWEIVVVQCVYVCVCYVWWHLGRSKVSWLQCLQVAHLWHLHCAVAPERGEYRGRLNNWLIICHFQSAIAIKKIYNEASSQKASFIFLSFMHTVNILIPHSLWYYLVFVIVLMNRCLKLITIFFIEKQSIWWFCTKIESTNWVFF